MILRDATSKDIPELMEFQINMALETENVTLDRNTLRIGMETLFNDPSKGKYYAAEIDGKLAACLLTTFEWSEWRNGTVLWIQSVYVASEHRGKGIYKSLYQHIQNKVNEQPDLRGVRLYADKNNKDAQNVYLKLGMNGEHYQVFEWMKP